MGEAIKGLYEGEGPNVSGNYQQTAVQPDVPTSANAIDPSNKTGAKAVVQIAVDLRRRIRTSSEPARDATAISYGGGDQILTKASRAIYISTAGNLAVRFADSAGDVTLTGLLAGQVYSFALAIIRQTSSTAAGVVLF